VLATILVLIAAVLHATWNTLIKFSGERLLVIASMDIVAFVLAVIAVGFVSPPAAEVWPWLVASALFELFYRALLIRAYRVGDLGLVYPLMRGLSPLVVLALTLFFAGEQLSTQQILGILLIPCGMICLLWQGGGGDRLPWSMLPVVGLIGLCIGCYTWIDGQALKLGVAPLNYLVWLTLISAWPFPLLAMVGKRPAFMLFWREQWKLGLSVGFCVLFSYALVLWAMQLGSVAEAAALREVSVVLVVLFGMRYLKEPFGRPRLLACGLVLLGMLLMKLKF
jgi:drug/metabolite transporter (DMT)-like permease